MIRVHGNIKYQNKIMRERYCIMKNSEKDTEKNVQIKEVEVTEVKVQEPTIDKVPEVEVTEVKVPEPTIEKLPALPAPPAAPQTLPKITEKGIVVDCAGINLREEPSLSSVVLEVITKGSRVMLDDSGTDDFYGVTAKSGVSGFCLKSFIKVY